jgi:hypothetical protein
MDISGSILDSKTGSPDSVFPQSLHGNAQIDPQTD